MTKINWKAGTLLAPVPPALISCGTMKKPNVMTAAWTGILNSEPAMTYVSIRPERFSHGIITQTREFVINLPTLDMLDVTDWCGVKSGANVDKFKETGLTPEACQHIAAPQIAQSPLSLECQVTDIQHLGSHDMFLARILGVNVDDKFIDEAGCLRLEKAGLLGYIHGFYFTMGRKLEKFGFSVQKGRPTPVWSPKKESDAVSQK